MDKKYNVYIVEIKTGKAESLAGSNMREERAEQRVMTALMMVDRDSYFVGDYEVGSKEDKKFASHLAK